jgi:hypothetical protein
MITQNPVNHRNSFDSRLLLLSKNGVDNRKNHENKSFSTESMQRMINTSAIDFIVELKHQQNIPIKTSSG